MDEELAFLGRGDGVVRLELEDLRAAGLLDHDGFHGGGEGHGVDCGDGGREWNWAGIDERKRIRTGDVVAERCKTEGASTESWEGHGSY